MGIKHPLFALGGSWRIYMSMRQVQGERGDRPLILASRVWWRRSMRVIILPASPMRACADTGTVYPQRKSSTLAAIAHMPPACKNGEENPPSRVWRGKGKEDNLYGITLLFNRGCQKGRESPYAGREEYHAHKHGIGRGEAPSCLGGCNGGRLEHPLPSSVLDDSKRGFV